MDEREDERRRLVAEARSFTSIGLFSDSIFAAWAYGVQKPAFDAKNYENTRTDTTERAVKKRKDFFRSRAKPFIFSANVRKCPRSTCRTSSVPKRFLRVKSITEFLDRERTVAAAAAAGNDR